MFKKETISIKDKKTYYWEKNKKQKQVTVILHGFPGNHRVIVDMARGLGNCHIIIPDLPACGQSESLSQTHSLNNYAEWLNNFLIDLSIDKITLIGYSFGSRVAVTFSALYPEKVEKLVLVTPVVKPDSLIARLAAIEYKIAGKLPSKVQKKWLANKIYHSISNMIIFKSASKKRRKYLIDIDAEEIEHLDPKANIEIFNELVSSKTISNGNKINIRTLIIACDKDEIATVNSVKELLNRFTNADFKIIEDSGHIVIAERPQKVAKTILDWFNKVA